jgi:hypothetical protein
MLGEVALGAASRMTAGPRLLTGVALLLVLVQLAVLTPAIALVGRSIDFLPRPLSPEIARRFGALHGAYLGADLLKATLVALAAWKAGRSP